MVRRMNEVYPRAIDLAARCSGTGPARVVAYSAHGCCASVRRCRGARRPEDDHRPLALPAREWCIARGTELSSRMIIREKDLSSDRLLPMTG